MPDQDRFPRPHAAHTLAPLSAAGWYFESQIPRSRQPEFPPDPDPLAAPPASAPTPAPQRHGIGWHLRNLGASLARLHDGSVARLTRL